MVRLSCDIAWSIYLEKQSFSPCFTVFIFLFSQGYRTLLWRLPQASNRCSGDRQTFQREASDGRYRRNKGMWLTNRFSWSKSKAYCFPWVWLSQYSVAAVTYRGDRLKGEKIPCVYMRVGRNACTYHSPSLVFIASKHDLALSLSQRIFRTPLLKPNSIQKYWNSWNLFWKKILGIDWIPMRSIVVSLFQCRNLNT